MPSLLQDLRFAIRTLTRDRRFAVAAVLILAVGVAINTAVLSVVNAYLLRPLPFSEPDRVLTVHWTPRAWDPSARPPAGLIDVDWSALDDVFEHVAGWDLDAFTIIGRDRPERVPGAWITPGYFGVLEVQPALGRTFTQAETRFEKDAVAVISYGLWQRRYGGDPEILGKTITAYAVDRPEEVELFTVVGVLPKDFWHFNRPPDILIPLRGPRLVSLVRLRQGVSSEAAAQHMTQVARAQLEGIDPEWRVELVPAHEQHVSDVRPALLILLAAVALVLLIAAANTAILILVRASRREREFTVRRALGAGSAKLAQQLVAEGIVLATLAAAIGVFLVWVGLDFLAAAIQEQLGSIVPGGPEMIRIDATVLAVTLAVALLTGVGFGLVPLLASSRADIAGSLREGGYAGTEGKGRRRARNVLVVAEVSLSLALLIAAGLMTRSARHLQSVELGFRPERVTGATLYLRLKSYPDGPRQLQFFDRVLERTASLPGVESAALAEFGPLSFPWGMPLEAEGRPLGADLRAVHRAVTPGYFGTLGIPLLRGRDFGPGDGAEAPPVIIVSQSLAQRLWPGEDPIGKRIRRGEMMIGWGELEEAPWRTVVGVVGDELGTLTEDDLPDTYIPYHQHARPVARLIVRTAPGIRVADALDRIIRQLDPTLPLGDLSTLEADVAEATAHSRFVAALLAAFSIFSVTLAAMGLYAVISYAVTRRHRDIAIRLALGAERAQVVRLFLREGALVLPPGLALGLLAGLGLSRGLSGQLYGVSPGDPATYALLALLMGAVALLATWIPARRASRSDPMSIMRSE